MDHSEVEDMLNHLRTLIVSMHGHSERQDSLHERVVEALERLEGLVLQQAVTQAQVVTLLAQMRQDAQGRQE